MLIMENVMLPVGLIVIKTSISLLGPFLETLSPLLAPLCTLDVIPVRQV